ncbi:MAG TPA: helix-turn-helix domain-containing protein, partial [Thermomicrobiales bacterium]|nr:helix-turn-helix domain-containing protein [Thermomicrobiales bacterium]
MHSEQRRPSKAEFLTAWEAAAQLGVHERTVRRAIARGALPATKHAGVYRIAPEDLGGFRAASAPGQESEPPVPRPPQLRLVALPSPLDPGALPVP